ncbi:MAG: cytochrome c biogenesis CcdA family protein [Candidatus Heimdallarchaeota archaeon]
MSEPAIPFLVSVFILGLTTTMSPCLFPVLPTFVTYMVGATDGRKRGINAGIACTLGIVTSFLFFGLVASYIGSLLITHYSHLNIILGFIIMLLGIIMLTPLKQLVARVAVTHPLSILKVQGTNGAFIVGAAFAFIAAPCVAPVFLGIVILSSLQDFLWACIYMNLFALGAGIPFLLVGIFAQKMDSPLCRKYTSFIVRWSSYITGGLLLTIGGLLVAQNLSF